MLKNYWLVLSEGKPARFFESLASAQAAAGDHGPDDRVVIEHWLILVM